MDEYIEKYKNIFYWVFWVWEDYLNKDMVDSLKETIDKIYADGFNDWYNADD